MMTFLTVWRHNWTIDCAVIEKTLRFTDRQITWNNHGKWFKITLFRDKNKTTLVCDMKVRTRMVLEQIALDLRSRAICSKTILVLTFISHTRVVFLFYQFIRTISWRFYWIFNTKSTNRDHYQNIFCTQSFMPCGVTI